MKPTVINIKDAPKGWETNPDYVYIGRTRYVGSTLLIDKWGNPHPIDRECPLCKVRGIPNMIHLKGQAIAPYEEDLRRQVQSNPGRREAVKALKGKILVCFCKPGPCHGDVLAQLCEELNDRADMAWFSEPIPAEEFRIKLDILEDEENKEDKS